MAKKEADKPRLKLKSGFYQQYRYDRQSVNTGIPLPRLNKEVWALVKKILIKVGKGLYYALLFFLCSVGITALLNVTIRQILLESLFGAG